MHRGTRIQEFTEVGKVVGRRETNRNTIDDAAILLRTAWSLRRTPRLVPKGVHRLATFEEADDWMNTMIAHAHAHRLSRMLLPGSVVLSTTQEPVTS